MAATKAQLDPASLLDAEAIRVGGTLGDREYRAVLDALPAAVYTTDSAGRITYFNQAAVELAGREPKLGKDEWCVTWRLYRADGTPLPHDSCPMAIALRENRPVRGVEAILERPDGTRIPFMPYPTPLHDRSGSLVGAVNMLIDISDRKAAENVRAYLAAIVDSSDDAIISKNLNGIVTSWNRGAQAIFGYRADEMIGEPINRLFPPDRLEEERSILSRIRRGERVDHFETVRRRKDGAEIFVSLTLSPVHDDHGRIVGVSKIARDITEQKRSEAAQRDLNDNLERRVAERTRELAAANERLMTEVAEREHTEELLLQAQKMEAVGQLASGLAHDFNNLLAAILGNLELIEMRTHDEHLLKLVQAAARSARRGAKLNEQMLAFSRKQHLSPRPVDVNALILGVEELLRRTLGGTVEVTTPTGQDLWPAAVDPHQLELVLLNLAINARDAMPQGGQLVIETRNVRAADIDASLDLAPGDYVLISVADTGVGMSPETMARACEPFFTTKEPGKGSGLGLAQVYGVARQSGGCLAMTSVLGKGTRVDLHLPRSLEGITQTPELHEIGDRSTARGGARVLVVDDHDEVREVIVAYLEALGYQAFQASSGRTALDLLTTNRASVDLLIADYAMPEMSGLELLEAARRECPDLPVIIVTGYADAAGFDAPIDAMLLKKPFRMNELGTMLEVALSHRSRPAGGEAQVVPLRVAKRR